jgi:hypothetical protein
MGWFAADPVLRMTHSDMAVSPVFLMLATIDVATLVLRQASFVLRAS